MGSLFCAYHIPKRMLKGRRNVLNPKTRLKEVAALEPSALASLSAFFVRLFEDFRRGLSYHGGVGYGGGYLGTIKGVWEIWSIIITQKYAIAWSLRATKIPQ